MRAILTAAIFAIGFAVQAWAQVQSESQLKPPKGPSLFSLHEALGSPENLTIRGTFRPRYEILGGQFRPAPSPPTNDLLSLQTTLFAEYDAGPVRIGGEVFDSRAYLQRRNSNSISGLEVNALELGQAYLGIDLKDTGGEGTKSTLTAGRFTQNVGSRRLVSRQQFRNTINAFTGIAYDWQNAEKDKLRLFYTLPHTRLPDDRLGILANEIVWDLESTDLQFFGASYTRAGILGGTFEVYGYGLLERDASSQTAGIQTRDRRLFTPGFRLFRAPKVGNVDYELEGIYQTGLVRETPDPRDVTDLPVSAGFVHAELGYSFEAPWTPRVSLQYDHATGDGSDPRSFNRFDTLFGARRFEYGPTGLFGAVQRANLISPGLRLELLPSARWDLFAEYRLLYLDSPTDSFAATAVRDRTGQSGTFAGQQIEGRVRHWLVPDTMRVDVGAAYLIKGDFLRNAPSAPGTGDTIYGYLETTIFF